MTLSTRLHHRFRPCAALAAAFAVVLLSGPAAVAQGRGGPAPVIAQTVEARSFATQIEAIGTLEPREMVDLAVNVADRVTAIYFDDGQRVTKGQTLLSLAQREQVALVEASEANVAEARTTLERYERLREQDAISEAALDQARRDFNTATANLRAVQSRQKDRILVAPFDGVLGFRQVSVGAFLSPGETVARLIDDTEMRMEFSVPSVFLSEVMVGAPVLATTDALPDTVVTGTVTSIDNLIDPATRAFRVRATLPNADGRLKSGMFMMVDLTASPRTSLAVAESAVEPVGPRNFVYVIAENDDGVPVAKRREARLGARQEGLVEVLSGLEVGEVVVRQGLIRVRDGAPVAVQDSAVQPAGRGPMSGSPSMGSVGSAPGGR